MYSGLDCIHVIQLVYCVNLGVYCVLYCVHVTHLVYCVILVVYCGHPPTWVVGLVGTLLGHTPYVWTKFVASLPSRPTLSCSR